MRMENTVVLGVVCDHLIRILWLAVHLCLHGHFEVIVSSLGGSVWVRSGELVPVLSSLWSWGNAIHGRLSTSSGCGASIILFVALILVVPVIFNRCSGLVVLSAW